MCRINGKTKDLGLIRQLRRLPQRASPLGRVSNQRNYVGLVPMIAGDILKPRDVEHANGFKLEIFLDTIGLSKVSPGYL